MYNKSLGKSTILLQKRIKKTLYLWNLNETITQIKDRLDKNLRKLTDFSDKFANFLLRITNDEIKTTSKILRIIFFFL